MNKKAEDGRIRKAIPSLCKVDSEVVRHLAINRFAKQADLFDSICGLSPSYNLHRSIRRLKAHGLIETLRGDSNVHLGYRLTKKGLRYAATQLQIPESALKSRPAFRSQYDHDRVVNEARRILSESSAVSDFVTEAELRSNLGQSWREHLTADSRDWKVPDALFRLTTKDGPLRVALEVELSQKAKARYAKIMQTVLTSRQFEIVFFICKDEKLQALIRSEVANARARSPLVRASQRSNGLYVTTLDSLRSEKIDAPWVGEESRFTIREVEESLKTKQAG